MNISFGHFNDRFKIFSTLVLVLVIMMRQNINHKMALEKEQKLNLKVSFTFRRLKLVFNCCFLLIIINRSDFTYNDRENNFLIPFVK